MAGWRHRQNRKTSSPDCRPCCRAIRQSLLALAFLWLPGPSAATPLRLTVEDCVARAIANNEDVNSSRRDVNLAHASLKRSRAWLPANPYASAGGQYTSGYGSNYSFSLSQEVEVAGQRGKRVASAEAGMARATWELKSAEQTTIAEVRKSFVGALLSLQRLTLARQALDAATELTRELGHRPPSSDQQRLDLNNAKIQERRSRQEVAAAERRRDDAYDAVRQWSGVPLETDIDLVGTPEFTVRPLPAAVELIERALAQRPDLVARRHALDAATHEVSLAQRSKVPNVFVSGNVLRFEGATLAGGDIGMSIPVVRSASSDVGDAAAEHTYARSDLQMLEAAVPREVRDARRACATAATEMQMYKDDIVPLTEENLRLERRLHEHGDASLSDVIGVQIDLTTAQREYLDAVEAYNESLIDLDRVTGATAR